MIPYYTFPTIPGVPVKPFGFLVGLGIISGYLLAIRRAKQSGISRDEITQLLFWTVFPGLLGSHIFQVVAYQPHRLLTDPWILLRFNAGISSFGGLLSFGIAFVCYRRLTNSKSDALLLLDIMTQAFVVGWIFGRLGCALAHDHPGVPSNFFLAVQFPGGPRHDLGLYEFLFTIFILVPVSFAIARWKLASGWQAIVFCFLYGPFRLFADSLRTADTRYFGWTPGQYSSVAMIALGVWLYFVVRKRQSEA